MELTLKQALQKGIEAHKAGQVQEADRLYTAVLKVQPKHPDANHNMGVLAVGFGKDEEALPFFKTALDTNPRKAQFWLSYIDTLIKLDRLAEAKAIFDQAKEKGATGDGFVKLEQKLAIANEASTDAIDKSNEITHEQPNILDTLKLDQAIKLAKKKFKEGSSQEAKSIYMDILNKFPKNKKAIAGIKALLERASSVQTEVKDPPRHQLQPLIELHKQGDFQQVLNAAFGLLQHFPNSVALYNLSGAANKGLKQLDTAISNYQKALSLKPNYASAYNNMGIALKDQGKPEAAIAAYKKALSIKPDYAEAYNNLGNTLREQDKLEEASAAYNRALTLKPDYNEAYNNIGNILKDQGKLEEAVEAYKMALTLNPNYAEAFNNMGNALKDEGELDKALEAYNQAIILKPNYTAAYNNKGNALQDQCQLEEAIKVYNMAILIKPDFAEAYYNMGNALQEKGGLQEAIEAYKKAVFNKPDYAESYYNMGNALQKQGKLKKAIEAFNKAIFNKPDYVKAWNNLAFPLKAIKTQISSEQELISYYPKNANSKDAQITKSILHYRLHLGEESAERSLNKALSLLSNSENITIKNPKVNQNFSDLKPDLPDKFIALVHFGRSGTGLLHSLIDGHPKVSALPSIYFSEYFDNSTWEKIISAGWSEMANRFMAIYQVLFDASSSVPIETKSKKHIHNIGKKEGMVNVGDQRDEVLCVDKTLFRSELNRLIAYYEELDACVFFNLVHLAYNRAINDINQKNMVFYHIHNPDTYAQLNFVRSAPNANWMMMVREPLQSCESWVKKPFKKNDYSEIANKIVSMLFEVDNIIYHKQSSIGVRLEDLKEYPRKTIPALCKWMGIEEAESLYEMTAQGKKWWGDPTSPDFAKDGMDPFGQTSIKRKVGSIFSKSDQFILRTLFYPFSARFDYVQENLEQFKVDLQKIRPMLDEMFVFEKTILDRTEADPEEFMQSGSYLYLRSGLIERWKVLSQHHTYPNMIKPLEIN